MIKSEIFLSIIFVKFLNFSNLENFGDSWRENDASWKIYHGINVVQNNISDNFYFDYKANKGTIKSNKTSYSKSYE